MATNQNYKDPMLNGILIEKQKIKERKGFRAGAVYVYGQTKDEYNLMLRQTRKKNDSDSVNVILEAFFPYAE